MNLLNSTNQEVQICWEVHFSAVNTTALAAACKVVYYYSDMQTSCVRRPAARREIRLQTVDSSLWPATRNPSDRLPARSLIFRAINQSQLMRHDPFKAEHQMTTNLAEVEACAKISPCKQFGAKMGIKPYRVCPALSIAICIRRDWIRSDRCVPASVLCVSVRAYICVCVSCQQ